MADENVNKDDCAFFQNTLLTIRTELNKDKIKLWEPPFVTAAGEQEKIPEDLINSYSERLNIEREIVATALEELRLHAVEKLAARNKFAATGIATLKIKLGKNVSKDQQKMLKIETSLDTNASNLKEIIKQRLENEELKDVQLIFSGKILNDELPLLSCGVKNNSTLMVICLSNGQDEVGQCSSMQENVSLKIAKTRRVAEALAKRKGASKGRHERYYLEIRDQSGKEIELPDVEREALSLAMTFHDLGKYIMKEENYEESLLLFLESDSEFRKCRSEILSIVDNFALLCLDIVWCYFKMKNLEYLPDAEQRLRNCRESLEKSYGPNMERASRSEGRSGNEMKSYVRLNLLEAICAFHKGQYRISSRCLAHAEEGVRSLEVDDTKLSQVMSMGFASAEAKSALIACKGDVTEAVEFITKRRETQKNVKEKEKAERKKWMLSRKLGKTTDGKWVDADAYTTLTGMGFSKKLARDALKHSNNNINQALEIMQSNPELLDIPTKRGKRKNPRISIPNELVQQVVAMGFNINVAKKALIRHEGDVQRCIDELLLYAGALPEEFLNHENQEGYSSKEDDDDYEDDDDDEDSDSSLDEEEMAIDREVPNVMKEVGRKTSDFSDIDVNLEDEVKLIEEYRTLLTSSTKR